MIMSTPSTVSSNASYASHMNSASSAIAPSRQSFTLHPQISHPRYVWVVGLNSRPDSHPDSHPDNGPDSERLGLEQLEHWGLQVGDKVGDRYRVISPQVWLDTTPNQSRLASQWPECVLPYQALQPYALYVPTVYDVFTIVNPAAPDERYSVLLLDNGAFDPSGQLLPSLEEGWATASPVRQVYWLWQILELWQPLSQGKQSTSVLVADNIRVDGERIRLVELLDDDSQRLHASVASPHDLSLQGVLQGKNCPHAERHRLLGTLWQSWVDRGHPSLISPLTEICSQLQQPTVIWSSIKDQLNAVLLEQAAAQPLRVAIAGGSTPGPKMPHNEDSCYPLTPELDSPDTTIPEYDVSALFQAPEPWDELDPYVAIVCDGLGGHTGGEVASQLVVRSLKLQLGALLSEVSDQNTMADVLPPDIVMDQLAATIRIVNNVLVAQNDSYRRTARQRMGTTVVMALHLPQSIPTPQGTGNSHELYIANVGDSRAYWLTPTHCQLLTVDDRQPTSGIPLSAESAIPGQPESTHTHSTQIITHSRSLTQALGTKDGEALHIQVQRFIIEEDGVLLLCSDGLSDGDRVETHWQSLTAQVLQGTLPLNKAVNAWLKIANQQNGHDNTSVVLMRCHVSPQRPPVELLTPNPFSETDLLLLDSASSSLAPVEASGILVKQAEGAEDAEADEEAKDAEGDEEIIQNPASFPLAQRDIEQTEESREQPPESWNVFKVLLACIVLMLGALALGLTAWRYIDPVLFDRVVVRQAEQWLEDRTEKGDRPQGSGKPVNQ